MSFIQKLGSIPEINSSWKQFQLPQINTDLLVQYSEDKKVNEHNLKIYRNTLKEISAPLNFLNKFIRNHITEIKEKWLKYRLILLPMDLVKKLIKNSSRRKHLSQILWIELEVIEKENKSIKWKRKSLNIKPEELKNKILEKIEDLNTTFKILTETSCKNFPLSEKNLDENTLKEIFKINKENSLTNF